MSLLKKVWDIVKPDFLKEEPDLSIGANLSINKVSEIGRLCGENEGWKAENMRPPQPVFEKGRLVWQIRFVCLSENGIPLRGGHLNLVIDDETGNLVRKRLTNH